MKKSLVFLMFLLSAVAAYSMDGFFLGYRGGILLKIDVVSAVQSKRVIDPDKTYDSAIHVGFRFPGTADSHGFPRVVDGLVNPYGEMAFFWGYKFPKVFSLGFGLMFSNILMPYLMFDYKFTISEKKRVRPYVIAGVYGGLFDGFPIGITGGGGIDIYINKHFYFLIESKVGAEIFVARYYDDGINSNPIWHWDSVTAYAVYGITLGFGYQFKNPYTDENGKFIGFDKKELRSKS